jgi:hypothetical protein
MRARKPPASRKAAREKLPDPSSNTAPSRPSLSPVPAAPRQAPRQAAQAAQEA